jgi:hypothetical protein
VCRPSGVVGNVGRGHMQRMEVPWGNGTDSGGPTLFGPWGFSN